MPSSAWNTDVCSRSEEHTSELQSLTKLVCRLLLEKKKAGLEKLRPQYRVFLDGDLNNELNIISIRNFINEKRLQAIYAKTIEVYPNFFFYEHGDRRDFLSYPHDSLPI